MAVWAAHQKDAVPVPRRCRMGIRATSPLGITRRYASPTPRASRTTPCSSPTESRASRWAHPRRSPRSHTAHAAAALLLPHEQLPVACFAQICQALDEGVRGMRVGDRRCAPAPRAAARCPTAVMHLLPATSCPLSRRACRAARQDPTRAVQYDARPSGRSGSEACGEAARQTPLAKPRPAVPPMPWLATLHELAEPAPFAPRSWSTTCC